MARLCGRPGCSETAVVACGMVPEDLLFWIAPFADSPVDEPNVLCARHADAMVVPRGWTLDDRREHDLRLFKPRPVRPAPSAPRRSSRRSIPAAARPEQLQIDGTGEITRPAEVPAEPAPAVEPAAPAPVDPQLVHPQPVDPQPVDPQPVDPQPVDPQPVDPQPVDAQPDVAAPWEPDFDHDDDLNGLLEVSSPLLSRAFRGTDRPRR